MIKKVSLLILVSSLIALAEGHGYMTVPHGRIPDSFLWVGNFEFSGGLNSQYYYEGGDHHVCGNNGFGGTYYQNTQKTGPTTATYTSGSIVNMSALFTFAHGGYFRVKLCKLNSPSEIVSQACLDQNVLKILSVSYPTSANGQNAARYDDATFLLPTLEQSNSRPMSFMVQLPPGLTCNNCVVLWDYRQTGPWNQNTKYINTQTMPAANTGMENYNDVIWPHQSFRSCADIKIVADPNNSLAQYVANPVGQAKSYPQLFTCNNFGFEYGNNSMSPKLNPRKTPDKYKSNAAGLFCTLFPEDKMPCSTCQANCLTADKVCPPTCYCTWFPRQTGSYQTPIRPGTWDVTVHD